MAGPQLAYIGLGNIGGGIAKNLAEKGNLSSPLIIHNRTLSVAENLAKEHGDKVVVAKSIGEAVSKADIIFTCLTNDKAVQAVMEEALKGDVKGKLFVDNSTIHPDTTEMLAKSVEAQGAGFVASPVFGAPPMAQSGNLICVLSGPAALVSKIKPYTTGVMARANIDFSDEPPNKASLLKLIGNSFIIQMIESLAQGHVAAEKTGLGVENLHKFIEVMFPGPYEAYSKRMMSGDYYLRDSPAFSAKNGHKDAGHALDLAKRAGARMRGLELADEHLVEVDRLKGEKGDGAGIYGVVRLESGLPFGNQGEKE